ncbi:ester cyclase [Bauldia sp.]|uniref:ester cyclase n=1 Tax=Bauldia sp. TaxID=2575872 RepID=UPI003BA95B21
MQRLKTIAAATLLVLAPLGTTWAASMEEQKQLSVRSIDVWSTGNLDDIDEIITQDYRNHQAPDVDGGTQTIDKATWMTLAEEFHQAFPETTIDILVQVGEGNLVTTRWRFTATQSGTYLGLAPTGKTITWTGIQIDRFDDGKIAETWVNWDMYSMFEQLGLIEKR